VSPDHIETRETLWQKFERLTSAKAAEAPRAGDAPVAPTALG